MKMEMGARSESRPLPAAKEMGPTKRDKEEVYLTGILLLETGS